MPASVETAAAIHARELRILAMSECRESPQARLWPPVRRRVRFADPAAWLIAGAIEDALSQIGDAPRERIALILFDPVGPIETLVELRGHLERNEFSPLRFPAATPSSALAVSCVLFSLQGPSLTLMCPAEQGLPYAVEASVAWLAGGMAEVVMLCTRLLDGAARCVVVGQRAQTPAFEAPAVLSWLSGVPGAGPEG